MTQATPHPRQPRLRLLLPALAGLLLLGGCASIPKDISGDYKPLPPAQARTTQAEGASVRWGGQIIKTRPGPDQTCFFVLSRDLDSSARPERNGGSQGRFVACHQGFYDPAVYVKGRDVTFTGTVHGSVTDKVGKYDYTYPKIEADAVYLWPKRQRQPRMYRDPFFYDPFWGPSWYYPGYYWYRPRVIHVYRPPPPPPPPKSK